MLLLGEGSRGRGTQNVERRSDEKCAYTASLWQRGHTPVTKEELLLDQDE